MPYQKVDDSEINRADHVWLKQKVGYLCVTCGGFTLKTPPDYPTPEEYMPEGGYNNNRLTPEIRKLCAYKGNLKVMKKLICILVLFMSSLALADEAPKTTLSGTLGLNSKKQYILTVPTYSKSDDEEILSGTYDWVLVFPRKFKPDESLTNKDITVKGYRLDTNELLVVEFSGKSSHPQKKDDKKKKEDFFGEEEKK